MIFDRIVDDAGLSQHSYVVGCEGAGEIAVVDPRRDVDVYLDFAAARGVRITRVLETHIHADFASGAWELAAHCGATLHLSAHDTDETYEVAFPHAPMGHGDAIRIGNIRIEALHTPGHTPEHLSFLVYDGARSAEVPEILLSGDFLFVGSLGRPDLLGEEAKVDLARRLFASVRDVLPRLPDSVEVHPGHGAGSMCGSGMSGRPMSTLGFERATNPYLDPALDEDAFVAKILGSAPPFPPYYRLMKERNAAGPPPLDGLPGGTAFDAAQVRRRVEERDHVVVDVRDFISFGGGHIPGSFGIGVDGSLSAWAAWVVPYDAPILLVAPSTAAVEQAARALVRVGLDDVRGHLRGGIESWREAGYPLAMIPQVDVRELHAELAAGGGPHILDVRSDAEFADGHIEGALNVHGGFVAERIDEIPEDGPIAVLCGSGYRSTVAASVLKRAGRTDVRTVPGGMTGWRAARLPEVR